MVTRGKKTNQMKTTVTVWRIVTTDVGDSFLLVGLVQMEMLDGMG